MSGTIPVAPTGSAPNSGTPTGGGGSTSGSGSGTGGSSSSGGGGGMSAAERRMINRENEAKRKASQKYIKQAKTLDQQAQALLKALRKEFRQGLGVRLGNVARDLKQQDKILTEGYRDRVKSLAGAAEDNEKAESAQTFANLGNRGRERANALSEAMLQGAGESDVLRAQGASLRNWQANQLEVNRGFHDTLRSVNSSLTDLNADTKTARVNLVTETNADREQLWDAYWAQRSEAFTQLGNIRGQQAELYGLANEAVSSKKTRRRLNAMEKAMGWAFDSSAEMMGKAWKDPGVPKALMNWQGHDDFEGTQNLSEWRNVQTDIAVARPEGATLRAWSQ